MFDQLLNNLVSELDLRAHNQDSLKRVKDKNRNQEMALSASSSRYDIEKFNGNNDFALWKIKMQALLENLGLKEALKEE